MVGYHVVIGRGDHRQGGGGCHIRCQRWWVLAEGHHRQHQRGAWLSSLNHVVMLSPSCRGYGHGCVVFVTVVTVVGIVVAVGSGGGSSAANW